MEVDDFKDFLLTLKEMYPEWLEEMMMEYS
jgi:hypothetical protein